MILEVKDFNVTYVNKHKKVYAVKDVSLNIDKGDSLGLVGESGSGKSTLAMALLRLLPKKSTQISGTANFLGKDLVSLSEEELKEIRWKEISVVFQKSMNSLSPVHRIRTQVEDIYRVHNPKASKEEIRHRFTYLLELVNLSDRVYNLYPHELSGGMLQRVSIAISLLHNPKLLIMDEATTALDVVTQGQILDEVVKMEKEMDMTRIMITHDMSVVASSCNKVAVMYLGKIVEYGEADEVINNPKHPYTQALISNCGSIDPDEVMAKIRVEGEPPTPINPGPGCYFAPRCFKATDECFKVYPATYDLGDGHKVACDKLF